MLELSLLGLAGIALMAVALVADWQQRKRDGDPYWTWRARR